MVNVTKTSLRLPMVCDPARQVCWSHWLQVTPSAQPPRGTSVHPEHKRMAQVCQVCCRHLAVPTAQHRVACGAQGRETRAGSLCLCRHPGPREQPRQPRLSSRGSGSTSPAAQRGSLDSDRLQSLICKGTVLGGPAHCGAGGGEFKLVPLPLRSWALPGC